MIPKPILLSVFYLFSCMVVLGQQPEGILALPDDTVKVDKLTTYAKGILHQDPKKAQELSVRALQLSKKLQYYEGIAQGNSLLGVFEFSAGKHRASIPYFNEAVKYYKKANNDMGVAKCLGNLAGTYIALGKSDSSIVCRMAAIALLEKHKDSPSFTSKGMSTLSMQYHNLATAYENLLKQYNKSFSYYRKAEQIAREANDTSMIVTSLWAVVQHLEKRQQGKEAIVAAEEALHLAKASGDNFLLSHGYQCDAIALLANNRLEEAAEAARLGIRYAESSQDIIRIISCSITYSDVLNKKNDYSSQIAVLEKVLQKVNGNEHVEFMYEIYEPLAKANYKIGNYKAAYDYLTKQLLFKDSVVKVENNRIMADMEFRYQTAQKEKTLSEKQLKIAQKDLQLQKSRQYTSYSIGAALLALLVAIFIYLDFKNKRKLHLRQLKTIEQEKEIQLLQAVMQGEEKERSRIAKDLHDGVAGMLAAVKMHLSSGDGQVKSILGYQQAIQLLDEATVEVRKTSHNLMPEVLMQHGLNEAIRRYCANISSPTLQVQYYFMGDDQRYIESFELSVYRIVQELLNNVFKHSKATEAVVQMSIQNYLLSISIEDNGIGFPKEALQSGGMGLGALKYRIGALNGNLELQTEAGSGVNAYLEFATNRLVRKDVSSFSGETTIA
jgi:signal transduction histidine kinase